MGSEFARVELTAFLKARRAAIAPESCGLVRGKRRLTPGLRREELAALAGVGLTWYTWLEQGRDIQPSNATLHRLATALHLSEADEAYLRALVAGEPAAASDDSVPVTPALSSVMQTYQGPAVVLDPMFELISANHWAERLFDLESSVLPFRDNQLWQLFRNPRRRALYVDLDASMRNFAALFRLTSASQIGRPRYERLIHALSSESADFASIWNERRVAPPQPRTVRMVHPVFGSLLVNSLRLPLEAAQGAMLVFLAPADEATKHSFQAHGARSE